jgi:ribosomal protein L40E
MAKKQLGFVELEWICPNCKTRNPGLTKTCQSCGSPQPVNVEFQSKADEQLITEEEKLKQAAKGPDIHCGFCEARNPADAITCSQCGGDIKEGKARQAGKLLGGFQATKGSMIKCSNCQTENLANEQICTKCGAPLKETIKPIVTPKKRFPLGCIIALGVACLLGVIGIISVISAGASKTDLVGSVSGSNWERVITVEQFGPVEKEDWRDKIPYDGKIGNCVDRVRNTSDNQVPNSVEVCGEPYKVDKGSGVAEVVQDCKYEVYDSFCKYTVDEWYSGDELKAQGSGMNVYWPDLNLDSRQREGDRSERFTLYFETDGKQYSYQTNDMNLYQQAQPGSRWKITVNGFGSITSLESAD